MREIVLDTETTGLSAHGGDRIVEIGCVELNNHVPTGVRRQWYINPERDVPEEAVRVHGLTQAFLSKHPVFAEIADDFLTFVDDACLVIHNASFDVGFLSAELGRLGLPGISGARVVDTLALARRSFPGSQASLDAMCRRFGIDNSGRSLHGALLDAQLLAECYLELRGGRQTGLRFENAAAAIGPTTWRSAADRRPPRPHRPTADELDAHAGLLDGLSDPIWRRA